MKYLLILSLLSIIITGCANKGSYNSNASVHKKLKGMWYLDTVISKDKVKGKKQSMLSYYRLCDLNQHPEFKKNITKKPVMLIDDKNTGKLVDIYSMSLSKNGGSCHPIQSFKYKITNNKILMSLPKDAEKYIAKMDKLPNGIIKDADIGYSYFLTYKIVDKKIVMSTSVFKPNVITTYTLNR